VMIHQHIIIRIQQIFPTFREAEFYLQKKGGEEDKSRFGENNKKVNVKIGKETHYK